jgi:hypothetical protein
MKIHLLLVGLLLSNLAFSQIDTTYYFDGDYSVSLIQDSCALKSKPTNYPFNGFVALGDPLFLCDRIYFKKGIKHDQKNRSALVTYTFNLIQQDWFVNMSYTTMSIKHT